MRKNSILEGKKWAKLETINNNKQLILSLWNLSFISFNFLWLYKYFYDFIFFVIFIFIFLSWGLCIIVPQGLCLALFGQNAWILPLAF